MSFNVQRLKELRGALGLSQAALARAAGVPRATIGAIEYGTSKNPAYTTVIQIARALGVDPSELFFEAVG